MKKLILMLLILMMALSTAFAEGENTLLRYAIELGQTLKHTMILYAALTVILFAVKISGTYSRVTIFLSAILYFFFSYFSRIAWKRVVRRNLPKLQKRKM